MSVKVNEYVASGVRLVWVVDPEARAVSVHRPHAHAARFGEGDELDAADVLPGFRRGLDEIFEV